MDFTLSMKADSAPASSAVVTSSGAVPRSRFVLFIVVAALGCAADLLTKAWCFSSPNLRVRRDRLAVAGPRRNPAQPQSRRPLRHGPRQVRLLRNAQHRRCHRHPHLAVLVPSRARRLAHIRPRMRHGRRPRQPLRPPGPVRRFLVRSRQHEPPKPSMPYAIGSFGKRTTNGAGQTSTSPIRCSSSAWNSAAARVPAS